MNSVTLSGNITADPELQELPSGKVCCKFTLAVSRFAKGGEKATDFFNCTAWDKQAEAISKYCHKGSKLLVRGTIQTRNYEDKQGNKRTSWDIIVQEQEFLSSTKSADREEDDDYAPPKQTARKRPTLEDYDNGSDSDIPF